MDFNNFESLLVDIDYIELSEEDIYDDSEEYKKAVFDKHEKEYGFGRTKLTKELLNSLVSYIKAGSYITHAAELCEVDTQTLYKWMKRGEEEPDSIYGVFNREITKADGAAKLRNELIIQQHAQNDWKASAWWLERRAGDVYGKKDKVQMEVTGPGGLPLKTAEKEDVLVISSEELKKMLSYQEVVENINALPEPEEDTYESDDSINTE